MEHRTDRSYPSAPIENNGSEQRLEKKLNDANNFNNSINNVKKMIFYFKQKKHQIKKREIKNIKH